jgi:hypothetical protein
MLFFAIVWSLWLIRNDLIFEQREPDYDALFLFILTRLCVWLRALFAWISHIMPWICLFLLMA